MSKPLRKLVGRYLIRNGGRVSVDEIPVGTVLGLYFADDWTAGGGSSGGRCRREQEESLEKLMKFYEEMKRMDRLFDVILIPLRERNTSLNGSSSSKGSDAGPSTTAGNTSNSTTDSSLVPATPVAPTSTTTSPSSCFLSLEGKDARLKEEFLIRKYGQLQPSSSLILIDSASATVINFNGMSKILQDPRGIGFPFQNRPYSLILSSGPLISLRDSGRRGRKQQQQPQQQRTNHDEAVGKQRLGLDTTSPSSSSPSSPSKNSSSGSTSYGRNGSAERPRSTSTDYLTIYPEEGGRRKDDFKGFFFGAYWCPPCRNFCSNLIQVYKRVKHERKSSFEVIFVSSDRSRESFDKFFASMPWLAVPFEDVGRREELTEIFNVKAIPSLIIVDDQSEKIITSEGRLEINEDLEALDFPWYPKLVEELKDRHSTDLNTLLCVIYFTSGDNDHEYERAEGLLHAAAAQVIDSDIEEAFQPKFFIGTDSELSESLRLFIDAEENSSYLVFLDIPHLKYCSFPASAFLDSQHVLEYVDKFRNSQLQCHRIKGQHGRITI